MRTLQPSFCIENSAVHKGGGETLSLTHTNIQKPLTTQESNWNKTETKIGVVSLQTFLDAFFWPRGIRNIALCTWVCDSHLGFSGSVAVVLFPPPLMSPSGGEIQQLTSVRSAYRLDCLLTEVHSIFSWDTEFIRGAHFCNNKSEIARFHSRDTFSAVLSIHRWRKQNEEMEWNIWFENFHRTGDIFYYCAAVS